MAAEFKLQIVRIIHSLLNADDTNSSDRESLVDIFILRTSEARRKSDKNATENC
ncbi:MAG: hypothetical protein RLZZ302_455, partial [Actinomycetota bacterium]